MGEYIPKDKIIEWINNYKEESESKPEEVVDCFKNNVTTADDYKVDKEEFKAIINRHDIYVSEHDEKPLILSIRKDNVCTGDYVEWFQYSDMYERWTAYIEAHGEEPNYVLVKSDKPSPVQPDPAPPVTGGRGKEMHPASDPAWTPRTGFCNPIQQVNSYDCSVHSCMQVIYAMLGEDLSEENMWNVALNNGWCDYNGASHGQLASTLNHFSGGRLKISWQNFSDLGFSGIKSIVEDPNRDFIVHGSIKCSDGYYGHYWLIRQYSWDKSLLSELRSICGATQENIITEDEFQTRIGWISQPSIGVVTYS